MQWRKSSAFIAPRRSAVLFQNVLAGLFLIGLGQAVGAFKLN